MSTDARVSAWLSRDVITWPRRLTTTTTRAEAPTWSTSAIVAGEVLRFGVLVEVADHRPGAAPPEAGEHLDAGGGGEYDERCAEERASPFQVLRRAVLPLDVKAAVAVLGEQGERGVVEVAVARRAGPHCGEVVHRGRPGGGNSHRSARWERVTSMTVLLAGTNPTTPAERSRT